MVAYIRVMAVEKERWLDAATFRNGVALCQVLPGATAMQVAAYVGLKTRGIWGAGASFMGFGLPAVVLMLVLAALYGHLQQLPLVVAVFSGLQAVIVAVVAHAAWSFGRATLNNAGSVVMAGVAAGLFGLNLNPMLVILLAASAGLWLMTPQPPPASHPSLTGQATPYTKPLLVILLAVAGGAGLLAFFSPSLFGLGLLMSKVGLLAFGGGFTSIPLMFHEVVEARHWLDSDTFMDGIVLGQVTPGPILITATFAGYLLAGVPGGVVASIGIFLPSLVLLVVAEPYFGRLRASALFSKAIGGTLCAFVGLLLAVTVRFTWGVTWDLPHLLLGVGAFTALQWKVDVLWVVLAGILLSAVVLA
jgi:chromate transporter